MRGEQAGKRPRRLSENDRDLPAIPPDCFLEAGSAVAGPRSQVRM